MASLFRKPLCTHPHEPETPETRSPDIGHEPFPGWSRDPPWNQKTATPNKSTDRMVSDGAVQGMRTFANALRITRRLHQDNDIFPCLLPFTLVQELAQQPAGESSTRCPRACKHRSNDRGTARRHLVPDRRRYTRPSQPLDQAPRI